MYACYQIPEQFLKNVSMIKNMENLKNYHHQEEPKET